MSDKDHAYVEMLNLMRSQGSKDNPVTLQLGIMQSEDSVKIGDLTLDKDDILIADHLITGYKKDLVTPYVKSIEMGAGSTLNVLYEPSIEMKVGLKKGDIVAVMKLSDNDTYVILAKVVSV